MSAGGPSKALKRRQALWGLSPWASGTCVRTVRSAPAARSRPPVGAWGCWWCWCWCPRWCWGPPSARGTCAAFRRGAAPAPLTPPSACSGPRRSTGWPAALNGWSPWSVSEQREGISFHHLSPKHSILSPPLPSKLFSFLHSLPPSLFFSPFCLSHLHWPQWDKYIVYHEVHDCLRHEVSDGFVDNCHVGIHQVPDRFHLSLQLRIHGVHETISSILLCFTGLQKKRRNILVLQM